MTDQHSPDWHAQFRALVDRSCLFPGESDHAVCVRLLPEIKKAAATKVGWTPSYLLHILRPSEKSKVGAPSLVFKLAVEKLYKDKARKQRSDKLRVYVPVESIEERDYINRILTAQEKRNALLVAAHFEDGEE